MKRVMPAPTTLSANLRVPSFYTATDIEAFVWKTIGTELEDAQVFDAADSCSCTTVIAMKLTFRRTTPQAMQDAFAALYRAAERELGATGPSPVDVRGAGPTWRPS